MSSISGTNSIPQVGGRPRPRSLAAPAVGLWRSALATPWPVMGFLLCLVFPWSFSVGSFHLTPYRVWLLICFLPATFAVFTGRAGRILPADWLMLAHGLWMVVALSKHHGLGRGLEGGGIMMVEIVGAYMLARANIRTFQQFKSVVCLIVLFSMVLAVLCIPESVTGHNTFGKGTRTGTRLGLFRAHGPFVHAIHLGVFAAAAVALVWALTDKGDALKKWAQRGGVLAAVMCSVSSGALATALVQILLMLWQRAFRGNAAKWKYLLGLLAFGYVFVDLLSNRTPLKVALHYLTFSAHTAYNRLIIWDYGKWDVINNPIFGIGFNVWSKPHWMHSDSMDNFWLVLGVRYGLPGFLTLAGAVAYLSWTAGRNKLPPDLARYRNAWIIMMIGMAVGATTVHLWAQLFAYYGLLIGLGAAFLGGYVTDQRANTLVGSSAPR